LLTKGYIKPKNKFDFLFSSAVENFNAVSSVSYSESFGTFDKQVRDIVKELDSEGAKYPEPPTYEVLEIIKSKEKDFAKIVEQQDINQAAYEDKIDVYLEKLNKKLLDKKIFNEMDAGELNIIYNGYLESKNSQFFTENTFKSDIGLPPIRKNKQAVDEALKVLIAKAAQSGVTKIVIPPADRIVAARGRELSTKEGDRFNRTYVTDLNKSLKDLEDNYPVKIERLVELPYDDAGSDVDGLNLSKEGTVIDISELIANYKVEQPRQFAQGGLTMKDQMEMNFGEAETVDPVSGNDVPPGSLPEEVRDDIPARLSEGEYVVPADVVRYYGVKFFEDLRTQAKMGLQQMDEDGRIGGEPIETSESEVDIDDLIDAEINNMNEGGVVSGYRTGGYGTRGSYGYGYRPTVKEIVPEIQTVPDMPEVVKPVETKVVSGFTGVKIYYNAQGLQVPIQFQNGQPVGGQQALKGLFEKNPMDEGPSETIFGVNPVTGIPYKNQRESEEAELEGRAEKISKYNFNDPDKLLDKIEELKKGSIEDNTFLSNPLSFLIPGTGLIKTFTAVTNQSNNNAQIRATAQIAKERGYESLSEQILEKGGIKGEGKGFLGLFSSSNKADKYVQEIQDAATRIISGKELPFVGDPADEKTKVKEGLSRADFAPNELGEAAFRKSMQASAPEGYTYVPGTTNIIPSSKVTSTVDTGSRLAPTTTVTKTLPSRSVTTQGYYQKGDDYATGYVGGKKEKGLVRAKLRPSPTDDTPTISGSSSVKGAYVTNAVDSYGNKIRTGTGVAAGVAPDTTYSYSNPKPGSVKDQQDKASAVSTPTTSTSGQSGTGWFRGADESGNTGSSSSKGGYSCYVATALNVNGYWNITKKVRLLKWCIDTKPEGKLDTLLWRNGYCVFGKKIIAPHVHNRYIQWLSDGFYESTVKNKNNIQATLGKLFFYVPSYTIGLVKALTGNLKTIDRT